jgi:hypothetical protein
MRERQRQAEDGRLNQYDGRARRQIAVEAHVRSDHRLHHREPDCHEQHTAEAIVQELGGCGGTSYLRLFGWET